MKKLLTSILVVLVGGFIVLWFVKKPQPISALPNQVQPYEGNNKEQLQAQSGKTLIIYYSFTGTTRDVALKLQEKTGADIYPVQLKEAYPATIMMYWTARSQSKGGPLPELQELNIRLADYDTILVGAPVWWYTTPAPLRSFLEETDFQGKKVAVFCTQGGNAGNYFADFALAAKNANLVGELELSSPHKQAAAELEQKLDTWLSAVLTNK